MPKTIEQASTWPQLPEFETTYTAFTSTLNEPSTQSAEANNDALAEKWLKHFPTDLATILRQQPLEKRVKLAIRLGLNGLYELDRVRYTRVREDNGWILNYIQDYYNQLHLPLGLRTKKSARNGWFSGIVEKALEEIELHVKPIRIKTDPQEHWSIKSYG